MGNFARNLEAALRRLGHTVETRAEIQSGGEDVLLIQHEFALYDNPALQRSLTAWKTPRIFFAHSKGTESFSRCVDGFAALCDGMLPGDRPGLVLPHPGWQRTPLLDRKSLQRRYGWSGRRCVVGTNGFISPSRQFDEVLARFMPFAARENILVVVQCPRHASHDGRPGYRDQELRLRRLARRYPFHLRLQMRFLDQEALNRRLQACDLLWCWTSTPSLPYGSGTCSDQYGSGTRLVAARKLQHGQVLGLPNVVTAPEEIDPFIDVLKRESLARHFPRHDPRPLAWEQFAARLVEFLSDVGMVSRDDSPPSAWRDAAVHDKSPSLEGRTFAMVRDGHQIDVIRLRPRGVVVSERSIELARWWVQDTMLILASGAGLPRRQFQSRADETWQDLAGCGQRTGVKLVPKSS